MTSTYGRDTAGPSPTLVVVVHGDISDGGRATYHERFAEQLARPGVIAVALTRPGYPNSTGRKSGGDALGRQDNYTPAVVNAVGAAIDALRKHYQASRVVYVGHSGGAAIGGVILGRRAGLIDAAVLVSCPCDLAAWQRARGHNWSRSLSPMDVASQVPRSTTVVALSGSGDSNTSPAVAESYVAELAKRGVSARFVNVADARHGFRGLEVAVKAEADALLAR
nr:prolyl oligopeptidase family serine peptidase [Variibacter gotjawalensis]